MAKLDRLGWAGGLSFVTYGARVGIRVSDTAVLARLPTLLPPVWGPATSPVVDELYSLIVGGGQETSRLRRYHMLYWGSARMARTHDLEAALASLRSSLHFAVALSADPVLFVHAGVVGWRNRAIVLPGRSGAGKSTLVAALVRAGASYYSDEYAVFDADGLVHPYPKPLDLGGGDGGAKRQCSVESLAGRVGSEPLPVGLVVETRYRPEECWRPRALSPGQAVLTLVANTVQARERPAASLEIARRALAGAAALRGPRGESEAVARSVLDRLED